MYLTTYLLRLFVEKELAVPHMLFIYHHWRIPVILLVSTIAAALALPILAADMSGWSDKSVCRLVTTTVDNAVYLAEAQRRQLDCGAGAKNSSSKQQSRKKLLPKNQGIVFYSLKLDAKVCLLYTSPSPRD